MPAAPASSECGRWNGRRSALAGAVAGDDLLLRVGRPIGNRQAEGPERIDVRIGGRLELGLALLGVVRPELRRHEDGMIRGGVALEDPERQLDAGAADGRWG